MSLLSSLLEQGPIVEESPNVPQTGTEILDRLAFLVGLVAIGLPIVLIVGVVAGSCFRDSISHFYYAQFLGAIFVGMIYFIGGFLVAYTGDHPLENQGSNVAALGAFLLASLPTKDAGCEAQETFLSRVFVEVTNGEIITVAEAPNQGFFNLFDTAADLHMIAAGIVFTYLGVFCLVVLKRVLRDRHMRDGRLIESKRRRNRLYSYCGITILICVALLAMKGWAGSGAFRAWWDSWNLTFLVETTALWAFGLAWFAKGRVFGRLNDA